MKEEPLVSVIIPTYNRGGIVSSAISSVLNQTYRNFELLVVDDFSTDYTEDVVNSFDDSRVNYLVNERKKGAQGARNTGLIKASGEYIAFLDSDDFWLKEKIELQVRLLIKHKKRFCHTNWYENTRNEEKVINAKKTSILKENYIGTFSSVLMAKSLIEEIGLLDESLVSCQDWDYWIRLVEYEAPLLLPKVLLKYNNQTHERISNDNKLKIMGRKQILEKYYNILKKNNYLCHHYYILAIRTGSIDYLLQAIHFKISPVEILKFLYYRFFRIIFSSFKNYIL